MKKKVLATTLAAFTALACFASASCGGKKTPNTDQTLEIFVVDAGYGVQWAHDIAGLFKQENWVKEKYPELVVEVKSNDQKNFVQTQLSAPKLNTYDLMFGFYLNDQAGSEDIVDITESVYNQKVPGEDILFKDKMEEACLEELAYFDPSNPDADESYWYVPWQGGIQGIIYNADLLKEFGFAHEPYTTDELYEMCVAIKKAHKKAEGVESEIYPFIQSSDADYWSMYLFQTWWAQYQGIERYNNFYRGIDDGARSSDIFKQKGRLESLKVFEKLLKSNGNADDTAANFVNPQSFNVKFMVAQSSLLQGHAVFHVNGDWFDNEMKEMKADIIKNGGKDYTMSFCLPVISAIKDQCTTIEDDAELRALVKAIDENSDALTGEGYDVSPEDYDKVVEARFLANGGVGSALGIIPSYAKGKEPAIDFLRYMATDKALGAYVNATYGTKLLFKYDIQTKNPDLYENMTPVHKRIEKMYNNTLTNFKTLRYKKSFPLCGYGNVNPFVDEKYYEKFSAVGNTKTPQDFFDETIQYWDNTAWQSALARAGLN